MQPLHRRLESGVDLPSDEYRYHSSSANGDASLSTRGKAYSDFVSAVTAVAIAIAMYSDSLPVLMGGDAVGGAVGDGAAGAEMVAEGSSVASVEVEVMGSFVLDGFSYEALVTNPDATKGGREVPERCS